MSQTGSINGTTSTFASAASGGNPAASSGQKGSAGLGDGASVAGGAGREADRRTESGSRAGSGAGDVRGAYRAGTAAPASAIGGGGPGALAAGVRGADRVEVSSMALYLSKLQQLPAIREDLVARVRAEIEAGTYDTDEKITAAFGEALRDVVD
jgi:hypothetical protein